MRKDHVRAMDVDDRSIVELDQFLRETADIALGDHLMSGLVKASVTDVQVAGDTATATMGSQTFKLVRYDGSWYVSNPWNFYFRR